MLIVTACNEYRYMEVALNKDNYRVTLKTII